MKKLLYILLFIPLAGFGQENYSLSFSYGNHANIPISDATSNLERFTFEFWYYEESMSGGDEWIAGFEREGGHGFGVRNDWNEYEVYVSDSNQGCGYGQGSSGGGYPITQNEWTHLALSYNGVSYYFFVNGSLIHSEECALGLIGDVSSSIDINYHTWYGGTNNSSRLTGKIDEMRISNIVRYTEEFNPPNYEFTPDENTVGLWHFNQNFNDYSGNGNHGIHFGTTFSENIPFDIGEPDTIMVPSTYPTIQEAINASNNGDTVYVSSGVYQENIDFKGKNIVLKGVSSDSTIIAGVGDENPVVTIGSGEDTTSVLSGFTISGGLNGGIRITDASPRLIDLVIANNQDTDGGGIYISNSQNTVITNSIIKDNSSESHGGGIAVFDSSDIEIRNCKISNNSSITGGGIYSANSELEISHTVIYENESTNDGGGITISSYSSNGSSLSLSNATLYSNSSTNTPQAGGIILAGSNSSASISNSIIWDRVQGSNFELSYTNIQLELNGGVEIASGQGNIDSVALFVDAEEGDFSLQKGSPCIDAGNPEDELDPDGTRADIGAFYFHQTFGCTDSLMYNFNDEANTDDGSCMTYEEFTIDSLQQALSVFETVSEEEDYSLSFDGVDDYVELGILTPFNQNESLSLDVIFKWNGALDSEGQYILQFAQSGPGNAKIALDNNGQLYAGMLQCNCEADYASYLYYQIEPNEWYHVIYSYDTFNGDSKLWVNNNLVGEGNYPFNTYYNVNNSPSRVGNYHFNNRYFNGNIAYAQIVNDVLAPNFCLLPHENSIGYWNFNEASGDTVYDLSGNGNHGIIHGATYSEDVPDTQKGCTDIKALNYDETALCDNGSCVYGDDEYSNVVSSLDNTLLTLTDCNTEASTSLSSIQLALDSWNTTIDLDAGWNMFGYGCPQSIDLVQAMSDHTENIIIIKDNSGKAYMPQYNFNGIGDLTPGLGYQIKVTEAIEGFSLCDWYVNDIPEDNIVSLQEENASMKAKLDCYENPQIGDYCFGGIIFHVSESDSNTKYGLVTTDSLIGLGTHYDAIVMVENYENDGFDDWQLPSMNQLNLIYENLYLTGEVNYETEDIYNWYWAKNECTTNAYNVASDIKFVDGSFHYCNNANSNPGGILPIRAFGDWIMGCTDSTACNFNPEANMADGSCEYAESGYDCD